MGAIHQYLCPPNRSKLARVWFARHPGQLVPKSVGMENRRAVTVERIVRPPQSPKTPLAGAGEAPRPRFDEPHSPVSGPAVPLCVLPVMCERACLHHCRIPSAELQNADIATCGRGVAVRNRFAGVGLVHAGPKTPALTGRGAPLTYHLEANNHTCRYACVFIQHCMQRTLFQPAQAEPPAPFVEGTHFLAVLLNPCHM